MNPQQMNRTARLLEAIRLAQTDFILASNPSAAFRLLLDELLALTESEYGFIGEVEQEDDHPILRVRAYTDISWNAETRQLLLDNASTGLVFRNLDTLFGHAILTKQVVLTNDAPNHPFARGIPQGHPPLNAFLGIPFFFGEELIGLIGLANCPSGYSTDDVAFLAPLVTTCGILAHSRRIAQQQEKTLYLQEQVQQTQRLIEFSQKLAHDLNNLLTVTMTTLDTAMLQERPVLQADDIELIRMATTQASELNQKILSFTGTTAINRRPCQLSTVLAEVDALCRSMLAPEIQFSISGDTERFVSVDRTALQQALTNMLFNSIEAIEAKEEPSQDFVHILVRAVQGELEISIRDSGSGMDDRVRQRAFDPYFSTKGGNRGFGLSSVMGFVKSHAGDIQLSSDQGAGTQITLRLSEAPPVAEPETTMSSFQFESSQILVVDDEKEVRTSIQTLLEAAGAEVTVASSANEGLDFLANQPFDLLITDIVMPGTDGLEFHNSLEAAGFQVPTVFVSGQLMRSSPDEFANKQSTIFLQKPFSFRQLSHACQQVMANRRKT